MPFGGDDAQAAQGFDFFVVGLPLLAQLLDAAGAGGFVKRFVGFDGGDGFFDVAAQHDVGATPGHVGGDGDDAGAPCLGDDVGFAGVLLGVEHLMRQVLLFQQVGDDFGVFDGGGAHEHGLAALVAFANVGERGGVFFGGGFVNAVELVVALVGAVGRDDDGFQPVDFLEFVGFGVGRARHARELGVEAEVVLEGDGGQRLVFGLDGHAFLGFHGLVQAVAPAAAGHEAAREFIDDDDFRAVFAVLHHVVLVAVIQVRGAQGGVEVVHQRDVGGVIQRRAFGNEAARGQDALGVFVALFGEIDLMGLFVHGEVARLDDAFARARIGFAFLPGELGGHFVHGQIDGSLVFGLAADDERRARFVNEDGVHLVHDGVVELALHAIARLIHHVVAQVVKAVFVVGAVGDVGAVGGLLFFARHVRQVHAHRQAQEVVEARHPLRVAVGQVVIDRDHMHALARERVQIHGQRGRERFALARAHFGNLALVQGHAADQLHVKVAHLHHALGGFAHHGESFRQKLIQRFALAQPLFELLRFGADLLVGQLLELRLQRVDARHRLAVLLEQAIVTAAKELGQKSKGHTRRKSENVRSKKKPSKGGNNPPLARRRGILEPVHSLAARGKRANQDRLQGANRKRASWPAGCPARD